MEASQTSKTQRLIQLFAIHVVGLSFAFWADFHFTASVADPYENLLASIADVLCFSLLFAQFGLLTAWVLMGNSSLQLRLVTTTLLVAFAFLQASRGLGPASSGEELYGNVFRFVFQFLSVIVFSFCLYSRWLRKGIRIDAVEAGERYNTQPRFSIVEVMVLTCCFAFVFALRRFDQIAELFGLAFTTALASCFALWAFSWKQRHLMKILASVIFGLGLGWIPYVLFPYWFNDPMHSFFATALMTIIMTSTWLLTGSFGIGLAKPDSPIDGRTLA